MLNKNLSKILVVVLALVMTAGPIGSAVAAGYSLKLVSNISVSQSGQAAVKQVFSVSGANKQKLPAQATINVIGLKPAGLKAAGTDGAELKTAFSADTNRLTIDIPKNRQTNAQAWSFSINYRSELLNRYGAVSALQVPKLDSNLTITSQTTVVAADLDLGLATVRSRQPDKAGIGVGQQLLTFNSKGPLIESLLVVFGEQSHLTATFSTKLENNSWWWQEVGLTLPPDTNQQTVTIESIQPTPSRVRLDKDGNIRVFYNIGPLGTRQVEVTARLSINNPTYELKSATSVADTDGLLRERYTPTTDVWRPIGLELDLPSDATAADTGEAIFNGVVNRARQEMTQQEPFSLVPRASALKISDWLVGELRANGIPARIVLGVTYSDGQHLTGEPQPHAWVEANLAGVGWVTMDPYFGVHSGLFGSADPLRVALALWGLEDDKPPVDLSLAALKYAENAAEPADSHGQLTVSGRKYMILPFVSIFNQSVSLGAGGIVDGVTLTNQREELLLGSLAPYQRATQRSLLIGASAYKTETLKAHSSNQPDQVSQADSSTSYVGLWLLAGTGLLYLIGRWWRRRRPRQPVSRLKPSKESLTLHDEATGGSIENEDLVKSEPIVPVGSAGQTAPRPQLASRPKLVQ